jgi:hypothetical protein
MGALGMRQVYKIADRIGQKIYQQTGHSLLNKTPRIVIRIFEIGIGGPLTSISLVCERIHPLLDRAIVAPILEELIFRGTQKAVTPYIHLVPSLILSSLAFCYSHGYSNPGRSLALFLTGLYLGLLVYADPSDKGLMIAMIAHGLFNFSLDYWELNRHWF